jgi:hypothetical protein
MPLVFLPLGKKYILAKIPEENHHEALAFLFSSLTSVVL